MNDPLINAFNAVYGVDFSIEAFEIQGTVVDYNIIYRSTVTRLYKQAVANLTDGKINQLKAEVMLGDFENIMSKYRNTNKIKSIKNELRPLGGWKPEEALKHLKTMVADKLPETKASYAKQRYLDGNLPIRDMMSYTKDICKEDSTAGAKEASVASSYLMGLKLANKTRSLAWKIFHPIRNNAEQRDAKIMMEMLQKKFSKDILKEATDAAKAKNSFSAVKKDAENCLQDHQYLTFISQKKYVDTNREQIKVKEAAHDFLEKSNHAKTKNAKEISTQLYESSNNINNKNI